MIEDGRNDPLIEREEAPERKSFWSTKNLMYLSGIVFTVVLVVVIGMLIGKSASSPSDAKTPDAEGDWPELEGCGIHKSPSCTGSSGDMDPSWKDNMWNTPPKGDKNWKPGFQDMSTLAGYAQQKYASGRKSCTVNVITRTAKVLDLKYYFDGVEQTSSTKTYDSSYKGLLKIVVKSSEGHSLELDAVDFIWNAAAIKSRNGDYRNGQKGGIVELFGWPDEDIEKECKHIADAGYLGVKLFPHQEQLMSSQPMENILNPWYFMYQPVSYRLNGRMGTRDQLRKMINTCRSLGVRVYADAVVNHMTGSGNDMSEHRNPGAGCTRWPGKQSSGPNATQSPYWTTSWTFQINPHTGRPNNALEFPAVPYGPMDFHCEKSLNSWTDPNILNTGWLVGLTDLDTGKEYVRQRIADYFIDLLSIGFTGFRIDAAKHIHPIDLAAIIAKFKEGMGGSIPEDWITWLEVLVGGEAQLLVRDSEYSFTTFLTKKLQEQGISNADIDKVKIWWSGYPTEPGIDAGTLPNTRKAIQNDDHDQQNQGSSSRDMHGEGCVLVKGCSPDNHRNYEVKLFSNPNGSGNNNDDYPIRFVLSSYYYKDNNLAPPDGLSECSLCTTTCGGCRSRSYAPAYVADAQAYQGSDYTRVHRDQAIINAMRAWMHI